MIPWAGEKTKRYIHIYIERERTKETPSHAVIHVIQAYAYMIYNIYIYIHICIYVVYIHCAYNVCIHVYVHKYIYIYIYIYTYVPLILWPSFLEPYSML